MNEATHGAPERLRQRLTDFQSRLDGFEADARERLRRALGAGNEALRGLDDALARMSSEDWTVPGMRRRVEALRARAENLRATAFKRVTEMPGEAVSAIATGSRVPVQNLARGLERIAKRLEPAAKAAPADAEPEQRE